MTDISKSKTIERGQKISEDYIERSLEAFATLMAPVTNSEAKKTEDIILSRFSDKYKSLI